MPQRCELLHHRKGHCDWCGTKLHGRQTRWCSRRCARAYTANHRWTQAKAVAKAAVTYYLCANAKLHYLDGTTTTFGPPGCLGVTDQPEVNHIEPILGKHGTFGCHHHQSNLEVLCKPCHKAATAKQRQEGKF